MARTAIVPFHVRFRAKASQLIVIVLAFVAFTSGPMEFLQGEDRVAWSQFRGPGARGLGDHPDLPLRWSTEQNVAWKAELPGRGWSSPVVWGNRVFLTTVVNDGESEPAKKGLYFGGDRPKPPQSKHTWHAMCLSLETGEMVWKQKLHEGIPKTPIHIKSSYASETPVTDGERLYIYFGHLGLFCLDLDGKPVWNRPIEPRKMRNGWGTAASPVLHKGRLYLINDNEEDSFLMAVDAKTGEVQWRIKREEKSNWATPYVWKNSVREEIVTPGTGAIRSYDLQGKLLWSLRGMSTITIATPYEHDGLLYVSSGYVGDRKHRPIYAIKPGAEGDISLGESETSNEWIQWAQKMAAPYNPTTLVYDDQLHVLYDFGFFASFNARDGKPVHPKVRIPKGRAFTASPWAYNQHVFAMNEDGVAFVMQPSKSGLEVLWKNQLAEDDMVMATPAIAGDRLLIRTSARLYCIRGK